MNYGISMLFRAIPLAMAPFCSDYGAFISIYGDDSNRLMAGPVAFSLGMTCTASFATAATIIRQIIHTYRCGSPYALSTIGYLAATVTIIGGICMFAGSASASSFMAGYVTTGVGLIATCIATVAISSTRLSLAPVDLKMIGDGIPRGAFIKGQELILKTIAIIVLLVAWAWAFVLLAKSDVYPAYFVAGHVVTGLACTCTSLIALVAVIARQIGNVYTDKGRKQWPKLVLLMEITSFLQGPSIIFADPSNANGVIEYIMIGLGLVCYSISNKVVLLIKIWGRESALANRIPLIPVLTALACLSLAFFVFGLGATHDDYPIPAHVLTGLGAICSTFFPIVSILESGTSSE